MTGTGSKLPPNSKQVSESGKSSIDGNSESHYDAAKKAGTFQGTTRDDGGHNSATSSKSKDNF